MKHNLLTLQKRALENLSVMNSINKQTSSFFYKLACNLNAIYKYLQVAVSIRHIGTYSSRSPVSFPISLGCNKLKTTYHNQITAKLMSLELG